MPGMNERGMRNKTNKEKMDKGMTKPYPSKSKQKMEKSGNMSNMAMGNGRVKKKKEDKGYG